MSVSDTESATVQNEDTRKSRDQVTSFGPSNRENRAGERIRTNEPKNRPPRMQGQHQWAIPRQRAPQCHGRIQVKVKPNEERAEVAGSEECAWNKWRHSVKNS